MEPKWRATDRSRAAIVLRRRSAPRGSTMANPFQFLQDVRTEASKVTWPSRRETLITSGLVLAMVVAASIFFVAVDQTLRVIVGFVLSFGR